MKEKSKTVIVPLDFYCNCGKKIAPAMKKNNKIDWAHPNIVALALDVIREKLVVIGICPRCGRPTQAFLGLDELWMIILHAQSGRRGGNGHE